MPYCTYTRISSKRSFFYSMQALIQSLKRGVIFSMKIFYIQIWKNPVIKVIKENFVLKGTIGKLSILLKYKIQHRPVNSLTFAIFSLSFRQFLLSLVFWLKKLFHDTFNFIQTLSWEKEGDLTQSYDKTAYTNRKFENTRTTHKRNQKLRLHNDCEPT